MNDLDPAVAYFAGLLKETVDTGDTRRLRGMLSGRELPAIGGDLEPADVIQRALLSSSEYPVLAQRLGHLLASVIREEACSFGELSELPANRRRLLLNILYLAAELPAEEQLFNALKELLPGPWSGEERTRKPTSCGLSSIPAPPPPAAVSSRAANGCSPTLPSGEGGPSAPTRQEGSRPGPH